MARAYFSVSGNLTRAFTVFSFASGGGPPHAASRRQVEE
jgi:hypothetical protein